MISTIIKWYLSRLLYLRWYQPIAPHLHSSLLWNLPTTTMALYGAPFRSLRPDAAVGLGGASTITSSARGRPVFASCGHPARCGVPYNGNGKTMENILENHWAGENHWGGFKENPLETHWVHDLSHAFAVECRPHAKKTQNCSGGVCTREYCPPHIYFKPWGQTWNILKI